MSQEPGPPARPVGPYEKSLRAGPPGSSARPSAAQGMGGGGRSSGRHRAPSAAPSRKVKLVAFVLVPLLLLTLGAYLIFKPDAGSGAPVACGDERVPLTVTASPSLAPMLTKAATAFDEGTASWVDGRCTTTTIVSAEPNAFADTLRASLEAGGGANAPTAWVPDASIWREVLGRRPELSTALPRSFPVVAASPSPRPSPGVPR